MNDFLPPGRRKRDFSYEYLGTPAVKDAIEAIGVPHTEVDLILLDGRSVGFGERLAGDERVSVYPVFERFDVGAVTHLRPTPLRCPRFVLDVHLGRLARYLRLLGFDCRYSNSYADAQVIDLSLDESRTVLTRDVGLLKQGRLLRGYWLRATRPRDQLREVVTVFQLEGLLRPFSRCMVCNAVLETAAADTVGKSLPPAVAREQRAFWRCPDCSRVYWMGSHYRHMQAMLAGLGLNARPAGGQ